LLGDPGHDESLRMSLGEVNSSIGVSQIAIERTDT
jgi:hypothetical protein